MILLSDLDGCIIQNANDSVDIFGHKRNQRRFVMESKFKPDKGFFKYVLEQYSRKHYGSTGFKVEDYIREHLLFSAYGLTAWLRSRAGAEWSFSLLGIEEVSPHDGFNYYFQPPQGGRQALEHSDSMKIFRRIPEGRVDLPPDAVDIAKRVVFTEGWKIPPDNAVRFVFDCYKRWLKTANGFDWISSILEPLKHVSGLGGIAYKYVGRDGQAYWFSDSQIVSDAKELQNCINCEMSFPCTDDYSGLGRLCVRCYGEHFCDPEILKFCTRHECKNHGCTFCLSYQKYEELCIDVDALPIRYTGTSHG
jgi:hypothetical protein